MLDLYGWDAGMTGAAISVLFMAAIVIGAVVQNIGQASFDYEWVLNAIAAFVGGWLGSEALGAASAWGPEWQGMYLVPAFIGAIVLGALVAVAIRYITGGTQVSHPRPI
ncbi:MAG TPA: hypothetical protein VJY85_01400 [Candidatus Limnocylindria bacterium]|nr:hypothetical protein [Candidatus Limnocylindria bacterium]